MSNILAGGRVQLTVYEVGDMLTPAVEKILQSESPMLIGLHRKWGVYACGHVFFRKDFFELVTTSARLVAANHRYHFA